MTQKLHRYSAQYAGEKYKVHARNGFEARTAILKQVAEKNPKASEDLLKRISKNKAATEVFSTKVTAAELKSNEDWQKAGYKVGDIITIDSVKKKKSNQKD